MHSNPDISIADSSDHAKQNFEWANNMRACATIAVICLHTASHVFFQYKDIPYGAWLWANAYDGLARFCVPVFVMLSGALLLSKDYELEDFLKKRLSRIVFPLIFWSLAYTLFTILQNHSEQNQWMNWIETLKLIYYNLRDGSSYHLWYVYMIIGLYLFVPIIRIWIKNADEMQILYFLAIWLLVLLLNQPLLRKFRPAVDFSYFSGYLGYFVLGYYLSVKKFQSRRIISLSIAGFVLGNLITFFGTAYLTRKSGEPIQYFYENMTINILLVSVSFFMFFKNVVLRKTRFSALCINFLNRYSYGIYLVHVLFLMLLAEYKISGESTHPSIGIPIVVLICLTLSSITVYLVNKIPVVGKYISG
ncbi:MAG: acyltransferase family protein [Chitinophagaceae bacterium]|jgi:surface polysaccharide O-acyltransferase-like enzyme